jgi:hypothetical protein
MFSAVSDDGRFVAFYSQASNLISGDTNDEGDIFLHDWQTGQTSLVSVSSEGVQGNGNSSSLSISADGRYIAFGSAASNLVSGDTNNAWDVFVHDQQTGETVRVSIASDGTEANGGSGGWTTISANGRFIAFGSTANNLIDGGTNNYNHIFVHDRETGVTTIVSVASHGAQGNGDSESPSVSDDGRYVTFFSYANNLVDGDTNGHVDIFVHDRQTGQTNRVSVSSEGTEANGHSLYPIISGNGRYVTFTSEANNLVNDDTNGFQDIFVHDLQTGQTSRVSVTSDGAESNQSSFHPFISGNGRYVVFTSLASNLISGDTNSTGDIFVHDRLSGQNSRVSVSSDGVEGNEWSGHPFISWNGRYVTFTSGASNLVIGDTNNTLDVFAHDRGE